jgi:hypothetical protein
VSAVPESHAESGGLEQERRRLNHFLENLSRLAEGNVPPATFHAELLQRSVEALAAVGGAVWERTGQGNLQMVAHVNLEALGLEHDEGLRQRHADLLRYVFMQPKASALSPRAVLGVAGPDGAALGNPTAFILLLMPVMAGGQAIGMIEIWQQPNRPAAAMQGFLHFLSMVATLTAQYKRNQTIGTLAGQQQMWLQLEAFTRQIHGSLNPLEVSYLVANEGRRLIECDRVSVALGGNGPTRIEAVSGADVVERRSSLIQRMRTLCECVRQWGEKLVFNGSRDDSLPPRVLDALDAYLSESPSKLLVVQPLRDERQDKARPARAVLLMECFEPPADGQQLVARLDIIGRHASSALYNAIEHRRIPLRFIWVPLAHLQEGIGGRTRAIMAAVITAISVAVAVLWLVPYPLKLESSGKLLPEVRRVIYPPAEGIVKQFEVAPGDAVNEHRRLGLMYDLELFKKLTLLAQERDNAKQEADEAESQEKGRGDLPQSERLNLLVAARSKRELQHSKEREINEYIKQTFSTGTPGYFELRAPAFTSEESRRLLRLEWTVLNGNFREEWWLRTARPSDPLLRLGAKEGPWEIELKIPQKHIGQVLAAFGEHPDEPLDVDFLLHSDPTHTYRGKLYRDKIAGETNPGRDDGTEGEPEVLAFVRIDDESIEPSARLPRESLVSGTEVHARIRCGNHRLGYSLFYGVWEFVYEKVVFFF